MKIIQSFCASLVLALLPAAVSAHEFWLRADPFNMPLPATVRLTMYVGERFEGEQVGFITSHAARFTHHVGGRVQDLRTRLPGAGALPEFVLRIAEPGTHLFAYDSQPSFVTLDAEKFHAYLQDEGLEHIARQRAADGKAQMPGRERYRRHVKTLLQVGARGDATHARPIGQRLELIPATSPAQARAGATFAVRLLFDGQPLANALVKAWHRDGDRLTVLPARTDVNGNAAFTLAHAGTWMISTVHMVAANEDQADWDSFWGNLTFAIPSTSMQ